ncbi:MAG TPA: CopG family transcriptional regulator [Thermoanaerobaculia bacterium]|nr:CopG family transcriptional regulator [Thermoanaerobaculia bacterium]
MKRTAITLPDDLAKLVDSEARRRQTSVSEVVRLYLVQGLAAGSSEEPRRIPWAGMVDDPEMVPAARMEELPAEHW